MRSFRFGIAAPPLGSIDWLAFARAAESAGISTLLLPDHVDEKPAPFAALGAAAAATSALRIGTLVLGNDFRHPVEVAREIASLDRISDGRVELGIGTGWQTSDYLAMGTAASSPSSRIGRLREAVTILDSLLTGGKTSFSGAYYNVLLHDPIPTTVQQPRPPILVGGGGRRILRVAASLADIVNINFTLSSGRLDLGALRSGSTAATRSRVALLREAAGERFASIELSTTVYWFAVTGRRNEFLSRLERDTGVPAILLSESPHVLVGTEQELVETLERRRETLGISYVVFFSAHPRDVAGLVNALHGK